MNKQTIADQLTTHYNSFINYINGLNNEELVFAYQDKWTATQQLNHIVLSVRPLVQVFSMDIPTIEKMFGRANGENRSYEALAIEYREKLNAGGKAPGSYVPKNVLPDQRPALTEALAAMIKELCGKLDNYTEQDLDTYYIPHPLLGNITMREMLYNTIDHVGHHQEQTMQNLKHL